MIYNIHSFFTSLRQKKQISPKKKKELKKKKEKEDQTFFFLFLYSGNVDQPGTT